MCAIEPRRGRGMVMMLVLVLVALLLIVALAVITGSNNAAQSATAVSIKYRVLNAAEGAANFALDDLARNPAEKVDTHLTGTLDGAQWDAWIRANQLLSNQPTTYQDPVTGNDVIVPAGTAYFYGVASENGGHTTYVEAIAQPGQPLTLPPGVMNAANDVLDLAPMAINADPSDTNKPNDADVHANRDIRGSASTVVQGNTFAHGTDELPGANQQTNSGADLVPFPSSIQVSQAARTAKLSAQAGSSYTPDEIRQNGTHTYEGNVFIAGDLEAGNDTITFTKGNFVYVDGNMCIRGAGRIDDLNSATNVMVVAGNVEVANGGYATSPGQNTLLLVLGSDDASKPCSTDNLHAVDFVTLAGFGHSVGTLYAANGSIDLGGPGSIAGALDAAVDVRIEGSNAKQGMQFDMTQAVTTMNTGTLTFQSYIEY